MPLDYQKYRQQLESLISQNALKIKDTVLSTNPTESFVLELEYGHQGYVSAINSSLHLLCKSIGEKFVPLEEKFKADKVLVRRPSCSEAGEL